MRRATRSPWLSYPAGVATEQVPTHSIVIHIILYVQYTCMYIAGIALYVCLHPGTRYRRRGVNSLGNVANFVETEMVHTYTLYISVDLIVQYLGCPDSLWVVMHYSLLLAPHHQILQAGSHCVSYVLVRGSVPVFWTQPGSKYRPPPIIERGIYMYIYLLACIFIFSLSLLTSPLACLCIVIHISCMPADEEETQEAFKKHFDHQISLYNNVVSHR